MRLLQLHSFSFAKAASKQAPLRLPSFSHFPLQQSTQEYLQERDIHTPTYIQYALMANLHSSSPSNINHIVSPTGSGKTLAYSLPITDSLRKQELEAGLPLTKSQRPRALLILQGRNVIKDICHFSKLKCNGIGIGKSQYEQKCSLVDGLDILVAGFPRFKRMLDHNLVYLSNINWIVIDEVDTIFESQKSVLSELFQSVVKPKLAQPDPPRLILSSTTNPPALRQFLQKKFPRLNQLVDRNVHINLQNIKHEFVYCQSYDKHESLLAELARSRKQKVIVFCNTVSSVQELEYFLADQGFQVRTLHSQLGKDVRIRNYEYFRDSESGLMLATDLGARGLDFPKLTKVINYDFPVSTCDYLQRAGRTGRARQKGTTVSIYFKKDLPMINELKDASFSVPLKIKNSAYGLRNRQETSHPSKFKKSARKNP